ncbi:hypothetical protein NSND_63042 [Nitrospira sp. ND1]|nr:hypothetical protein NSND_63042 [Nitrospira sp. ND1]
MIRLSCAGLQSGRDAVAWMCAGAVGDFGWKEGHAPMEPQQYEPSRIGCDDLPLAT